MKHIVLFAMVMGLAGCIANVEMELSPEITVATRTVAGPMETANLQDTLRIRAIYDTDPEGDRFVFNNTGSIIHGPTLESGNVLWTDKSYFFEYDPTETPPVYYSHWDFYKSNLYIQSGREVSSTVLNQNISLTHIFTQSGSYLVAGQTMWRDPNSAALNPLVNGQFNYNYGQHKAEKTFTVVDPMSSIYISGSNTPLAGTYVTFSVPTSLPAGFTFMNWGIDDNNGRYGVSFDGSSSNSTVRIKFTTPLVTYGLTARFRLPDGSTRYIRRPIYVGDYAATLPAPSLVSSGSLLSATEASWAGFYAGEPVYWITPTATSATVTVDSGANFDSSATYEWRFDPRLSVRYSMPYYIGFYIPALGNGAYPRRASYRVECRASKNGQYSAWSSLGLFVSDAKPTGPYRAPINVDSLKTTPAPVDVRR